MRIRTSDAGADQTLDASSKEKYQSQKADHHGEWRQFISGNGYREAIFEATSRGHFSTVKWLYEEADQSQQKAVYQIIFNGASVNCHLDILKWLKNINTAFFKAGIDQPNEAACKFIINAFRAGRRDILDWFQNETRNEDWGITAVHPYANLGEAIDCNSQMLMVYLSPRVDDEAFNHACENGYSNVLKWLEELRDQSPKQEDFSLTGSLAYSLFGDINILNLIEKNNFRIFATAIELGHLDVINWLDKQAPNNVVRCLARYTSACFTKDLPELMQWLNDSYSQEFARMLQDNKAIIFEHVCGKGLINTLQWFQTNKSTLFTSVYVGEASNRDQYYKRILAEICRNNHLNILPWLQVNLPNAFNEMINTAKSTSFDNEFFRICDNGRNEMVDWLLPECQFLEWLESEPVYAEQPAVMKVVNDFMHRTLSDLRVKLGAPVTSDIHNTDQFTLCGNIARYMIIHNDRSHDNDFEYLMSIPALRQTAHDQDNSLIRLAYMNGNTTASTSLLRLPAVQGIAQREDYYLEELQDKWEEFTAQRSEKSAFLAKKLLLNPSMFVCVDENPSSIFSSFITDMLKSLHQAQQTWATHPDDQAVFDINDPERVKLLFLIARYLMRRPETSHRAHNNNELRFLLTIPAALKLAHTSDNELYREACLSNNKEAREILSLVPAVKELVDASHGYPELIAEGEHRAEFAARKAKESAEARNKATIAMQEKAAREAAERRVREAREAEERRAREAQEARERAAAIQAREAALAAQAQTEQAMLANQPTIRHDSEAYGLMRAGMANNREQIELWVNRNANRANKNNYLRVAAEAAQLSGNADLASIIAGWINLDEAESQNNNANPSTLTTTNKHQRSADQKQLTIPFALNCCLTQETLEEPVTISSGITMERAMLLESLRSKSVCPITKREITAEERIQFATNICLNACIEAYIDNGGVTYCQVMALLLTCPLTQQLLEDPVTYICGLTFERRMIEGIFAGAGPDTVIINDEKYNIKLNPADASSCDFITISNDQKAYKINSSELKRGTTIAIKDMIAMYHAEKAEHDKRSNIAKDTADEIESPDKKKMSGVTTAGVFKVESTSAIQKDAPEPAQKSSPSLDRKSE